MAKSRKESERLKAALVSEVGLVRREKRRVVKVRIRWRCWSRVCAMWLRYLCSRMSESNSTPAKQDRETIIIETYQYMPASSSIW